MIPKPHKREHTHPLPIWVRWCIVFFVLLIILGGTVFWIIQGAHAIIPIAVLTALSILLAFSQVLPLLFPSGKERHTLTSPSQHELNSQNITPASPLSEPPLFSTQTHSPDMSIVAQKLASTTIEQPDQRTQKITKADYGEAPHTLQFYGRHKELSILEMWIMSEHCRFITILGIGGMGKTTLATKLVEQIMDKFEYIFWRSLQNAPPLENILKNSIQFFSNQQQTDLSEDLDDQITLLLRYLKNHRCILILDNFETILQAGNRVGQYQKGYEGYGRLLKRLGETEHQSCLLLTSREKPKEIVSLEGMTSPVRSLYLSGLKQAEGKELLNNTGLFGSDKTLETLIQLYSGNPLDLKLAAEPIHEIFEGDILSFLKRGKTVFGDIRNPLDIQFTRLSKSEREIVYWLAIEREPVSLDDLQEDIVYSISEEDLLSTMASLRRRSIIESSGTAYFTLQPVIMEYVIDRLIEQVYEEINTETVMLFDRHTLIKAQAKDYIRDSQILLILKPLAERLKIGFGITGIENKLRSIISMLHREHSQRIGYTAGNILNLLVQLQADLSTYDFTDLVVRQAYLQDVALIDVNFEYSYLVTSVFTDTFGGILSVNYDPSGELLAVGTVNGDIRLWQSSSGMPYLTCQGHNDWVFCVAFSPKGGIFASSNDDRTIRLWDIKSGQNTKTLLGHVNRVRTIAFKSDGSILASGSDDQTVNLWDINSGAVLKTLLGHTDRVRSVAFSPDGSILASGSEDKTIRLWDFSIGHVLRILYGHTNWVRSVAFNPDGSMLASGGEDQTIRLWNISTGHLHKTLRGHSSWVRSVAFSPDGSMLASGSEDQTIRLWNISTGRLHKTLQGDANRVLAVAFSPNGSMLASGGDDGTVKLWDKQTGDCLKTLRSDRPYERMNITNVKGLTEAQKSILRLLGAIDEQESKRSF